MDTRLMKNSKKGGNTRQFDDNRENYDASYEFFDAKVFRYTEYCLGNIFAIC